MPQRGEGGALLEMQVGDEQRVLRLPIERAGGERPRARGRRRSICERSDGAVSGMRSGLARSMSPHGLRDELLNRLTQQDLARLPGNALAADLEHDRHGERRDLRSSAICLILPRDSLQESRPRRPTSIRPVAASAKAALQQDVVGLVLAQHVVDQVGGDRHLPPGLLLPGMAALDQARDDGADAEGALHQARLGEPGIEIVAEHVLVEQPARGRAARPRTISPMSLSAPDGERIFVGDEAERRGARALEPRVSSMPRL